MVDGSVVCCCRCVASGDMDGAIYLWDPKKGKPLGQCNGHKKWITSLVSNTSLWAQYA